jgi:hypothetical protein
MSAVIAAAPAMNDRRQSFDTDNLLSEYVKERK